MGLIPAPKVLPIFFTTESKPVPPTTKKKSDIRRFFFNLLRPLAINQLVFTQQ